MTAIDTPNRYLHGSAPRLRRIKSLRKQIKVLERMKASVWRAALLSSLVAFAALASVILIGAWFAGYPMSIPTLLESAIAAVVLLFLLRNWIGALFTVFVILLAVPIALLLEELPDIDFGDPGDCHASSTQTNIAELIQGGRRNRIDQAIAQRKALIRKLINASDTR